MASHSPKLLLSAVESWSEKISYMEQASEEHIEPPKQWPRQDFSEEEMRIR